jgi:hypothetical protein
MQTEVLTMKSTVFWDVMQYSPAEVHQRFGEIYCLHHQGQRCAHCLHGLFFSELLPDCTVPYPRRLYFSLSLMSEPQIQQDLSNPSYAKNELYLFATNFSILDILSV